MIRRAALLALAVLGGSSALAGQSNVSDPWKKVPLPTTCYMDRASSTKLHDIHTAMSSDVRKQAVINEDYTVVERKAFDLRLDRQKEVH